MGGVKKANIIWRKEKIVPCVGVFLRWGKSCNYLKENRRSERPFKNTKPPPTFHSHFNELQRKPRMVKPDREWTSRFLNLISMTRSVWLSAQSLNRYNHHSEWVQVNNLRIINTHKQGGHCQWENTFKKEDRNGRWKRPHSGLLSPRASLTQSWAAY